MIGRPGSSPDVARQQLELIQMISTSEVKVSCVIDAADGDHAIDALQSLEVSKDAINSTSSH